jgi:hypothetical protein
VRSEVPTPVDRTTGGPLGVLIDGDGEEAVVAPVAGRGQRMPVRGPALEEEIDVVEEFGGVLAVDIGGGGEDPEAGIIRQGLEGNHGHDDGRSGRQLRGRSDASRRTAMWREPWWRAVVEGKIMREVAPAGVLCKPNGVTVVRIQYSV